MVCRLASQFSFLSLHLLFYVKQRNHAIIPICHRV
uniref:Uncharacterized protein n=1 Tax=Anguilla anguilla TaxID=7936 RepID=A0A0E9XV82_ANGAN